MHLRPPVPADAGAMAALVTSNREHFRTGEPLRPDAYYSEDGQRRVIDDALSAARAGTAAMFVVEVDGRLVGRVNLNSIIRGAFQSASVGYVIDRRVTGRGVATAALVHLIDIAFGELVLHRLQAETLVTNAASRRVLERCGFVWYGRAPTYLRIDGRWQTQDLFQLINGDYPDP